MVSLSIKITMQHYCAAWRIPTMTHQEPNHPLVLLRGAISELTLTRRSHNFVLTENQHWQIGATAIAASVMGMGATGIGLLGMACNADEEADWVEFEVDGNRVKAWLWMMPMRNGDMVEVVAEPRGHNHFVAYAVKRDGDALLAVYPHATAGRKAHYRKSAKAWLCCAFLASLIATFLFKMQSTSNHWFNTSNGLYLANLFALSVPFSAVIAFRVSQKCMGFVRTAEAIFKGFGWPDVENIDLRQTSKKNRGADKSAYFGAMYFCYK